MSKKRGASAEQRRLMKEFKDRCCFEFIGKGGVSADDPKEFVRLWRKNITWLMDMMNETDRIGMSYIAKYAE